MLERVFLKRTQRGRNPEAKPKDLKHKQCAKAGGGGWIRTNDLRIIRCAFRGAATRIQSLTVGYDPLICDDLQLAFFYQARDDGRRLA